MFIGGGRTSGGISDITNGSVGLDLSRSTVDTQSLGLKGVQAANTGYDLSTGTTKVESIVGDTDNVNSQATAGYSTFRFAGPGFGDNEGVKISVNVNNVASTDSLVEAVNIAIEAAGQEPTSAASAFKAAGITAKIVTDDDGKQQLAFSSSTAAFQVTGGDRTANALLGNYSAAAKGTVLAATATGAAGVAGSFTGGEVLKWRFEGAGLTSAVDITLNAAAETAAVYAGRFQTEVGNNATLAAAGITMTGTSPAGLVFTAANGDKLRVSLTGDTANRLGMGSFKLGAANAQEYAAITVAADAPDNADATRFSFSFNGGTSLDVNVAWTAANIASDLTIQAAINAAIDGVAGLTGSGLTATVSTGAITFTTAAGTNFRLQTTGSAATSDYGGSSHRRGQLHGYASGLSDL